MSEQKNHIEALISDLKQERDELRLKMHLASMDAQVEYDRVSAQIDELTEPYLPVGEAVEETAENVWAAFEIAACELQAGYHRVRRAIEEN